MPKLHELKSWIEEKRSAYLYLIIATQEKNAIKNNLFRELADAAEKQALLWERELKQKNQSIPETYQPDFRTRIVGFLLRYFSIQQLRFILAAMKVRGM